MLRTIAQLISPGSQGESAMHKPLEDEHAAGARPVNPENQSFTGYGPSDAKMNKDARPSSRVNDGVPRETIQHLPETAKASTSKDS